MGFLLSFQLFGNASDNMTPLKLTESTAHTSVLRKYINDYVFWFWTSFAYFQNKEKRLLFPSATNICYIQAL